MDKRYQVLVLGYGEMGHAMQVLLGPRHDLMIWDKFPPPGFHSVELEPSVAKADIIIFCLPAQPHREVLEQIKPHLAPGSICVSIAKGLDDRGECAAQVFHDALEPGAYALVYGPMISEEIRAGRPAFAQVGCHADGVYQRLDQLFNGSPLYLQQTEDIIGISWSVILKNVYAMVFGIADELQLGDNMRGFLAVSALHELDEIVLQMGGQAYSPFGLAGLGDLMTTATSEDSHHHELGRMLARGETEDIQGEGVNTLQKVKQHGLLQVEDYPLFRLIDAMVADPPQAKQRMHDYLERLFKPL